MLCVLNLSISQLVVYVTLVVCIMLLESTSQRTSQTKTTARMTIGTTVTTPPTHWKQKENMAQAFSGMFALQRLESIDLCVLGSREAASYRGGK